MVDDKTRADLESVIGTLLLPGITQGSDFFADHGKPFTKKLADAIDARIHALAPQNTSVSEPLHPYFKSGTTAEQREADKYRLGYEDGKRYARENIVAQLSEFDSLLGDTDDEWTAAIREAFPTKSGSHDTYAIAVKMVGTRKSKGALVALVNWLLMEAKK